MNLAESKKISDTVEDLDRAISNFVFITEEVGHPHLFYAHCCAPESRKLMADACYDIATKDATDQIKRAKDALAALGVKVSESDISSKIEAIKEERKAFKEMQEQAKQLLLSDAGSQAVN